VVRPGLVDGIGDDFVGHYVGVGAQFCMVFVVGVEGILFPFPFPVDQFTRLPGDAFGDIGNVGYERLPGMIVADIIAGSCRESIRAVGRNGDHHHHAGAEPVAVAFFQ